MLFQKAKEMSLDNKFCPDVVTVLGYNSAKFDMNILFKHLNSDEWSITSVLGSSTKFKQIVLTKTEDEISISLRFIDAMALGGQGTLKDFISSFGTNKDLNKGVFPYDLLTIENYEEVLSKSEPFSKEDFNNMLKNSVMTDKEYEEYLEDAKNFKNRWDYLQYYNSFIHHLSYK